MRWQPRIASMGVALSMLSAAAAQAAAGPSPCGPSMTAPVPHPTAAQLAAAGLSRFPFAPTTAGSTSRRRAVHRLHHRHEPAVPDQQPALGDPQRPRRQHAAEDRRPRCCPTRARSSGALASASERSSPTSSPVRADISRKWRSTTTRRPTTARSGTSARTSSTTSTASSPTPPARGSPARKRRPRWLHLGRAMPDCGGDADAEVFFAVARRAGCPCRLDARAAQRS